MFFLIWLMFWSIIIYLWTNFRYNNKKEVDNCFKERKEFKEKNESLEIKIKEDEENIKKLRKDLEHSNKEIAEKNKYLSEDKVIIERLSQVKELSDNIADILLDYDKDTISQLLEEYRKEEKEDKNEIFSKNDKKTWW